MCVCVCVCVCSVVSDYWNPWTVARQALLSMRFSRQEYWSGLPFPPPGDLPDPGVTGLKSCFANIWVIAVTVMLTSLDLSPVLISYYCWSKFHSLKLCTCILVLEVCSLRRLTRLCSSWRLKGRICFPAFKATCFLGLMVPLCVPEASAYVITGPSLVVALPGDYTGSTQII